MRADAQVYLLLTGSLSDLRPDKPAGKAEAWVAPVNWLPSSSGLRRNTLVLSISCLLVRNCLKRVACTVPGQTLWPVYGKEMSEKRLGVSYWILSIVSQRLRTFDKALLRPRLYFTLSVPQNSC